MQYKYVLPLQQEPMRSRMTRNVVQYIKLTWILLDEHRASAFVGTPQRKQYILWPA